jgi:type IV secretory pathway ATPase VirB11/archaellum biosynthesis ATPase
VRLATLTRSAARFLDASVVAGLNILVAGGTQSGKTTMLNCLSSAIPSRERVVTCEEVLELPNPPSFGPHRADGRSSAASSRGTNRRVRWRRVLHRQNR